MNTLRKKLLWKELIPFSVGFYSMYLLLRGEFSSLPNSIDFVHSPVFHNILVIVFCGSVVIAMLINLLTLNWKKPKELYDKVDETGRAFMPMLYLIIAIIATEAVIWSITLIEA